MLKCHIVQAIPLFFHKSTFHVEKSSVTAPTPARGGPGMLRYYGWNNLSCSQLSFVSKVGPALSLFSACMSSEPHLALFMSSFHLLVHRSALSPPRSLLSPISFFSFLVSLLANYFQFLFLSLVLYFMSSLSMLHPPTPLKVSSPLNRV